MTVPSRPSREEVETARKWDPSAIFESASDWDEEFASLETALDDTEASEYSAIDAPEALASALEEYDEMKRRCGRLWAYAKLRADQDTTDADANTRLESVQALLGRLTALSTALERQIRTFDAETLLEEPGFEGKQHYVRDVFRRAKYTLDDEAQKTVDRLRPVLDAPDGAFQTFINRDYEPPSVERPDGESVTVTPTNRDRLLRRRDRQFRRTVHEAYQRSFDVANHLLADSVATKVERNVRLAELRGYSSAREAALDREPVNEVAQAFPVEAHDEMLSAVRDGLETYHRYYEAKRDRLGVRSLRPWDRYVALGNDDEPEIPYERASELVVDAVEPLGDAYQSRLRAYFDDRRIDVHETPNKTSEGLAYMLGVYDTDPYLLLNYQADLRSVFILAHELGHAMHHVYASENQPRIYSGSPSVISELPSNLHEVLLANHLADSNDPEIREPGIDTALRRFEDMFFRHSLLATFTHEAHDHATDGHPLTTAWLDDTYAELLEEFQAPLEPDESVRRTWVSDNQAHRLYKSHLYVMGRAGAHSVADGLESGELNPEAYQSFLRAGSSAYPSDLLDVVDLDMTSAEPYEQAIAAFDEYLSLIT